ncbi:MAG: hypothetical protein V1929_12555 [bacterium]
MFRSMYRRHAIKWLPLSIIVAWYRSNRYPLFSGSKKPAKKAGMAIFSHNYLGNGPGRSPTREALGGAARAVRVRRGVSRFFQSLELFARDFPTIGKFCGGRAASTKPPNTWLPRAFDHDASKLRMPPSNGAHLPEHLLPIAAVDQPGLPDRGAGQVAKPLQAGEEIRVQRGGRLDFDGMQTAGGLDQAIHLVTAMVTPEEHVRHTRLVHRGLEILGR